jgi:hypothetical protein
MPQVYIRAEWKGGENDKENLLQQIEKVNYYAQKLREAANALSFSAVALRMEEAPSEGKSDEASEG